MSTENQPSTAAPSITAPAPDADPSIIPTITLKAASNGVMMITKSAEQATTELHVDTADGKRNPTLASRLAQVLSTGKNPLAKAPAPKPKKKNAPLPEYDPKAAKQTAAPAVPPVPSVPAVPPVS